MNPVKLTIRSADFRNAVKQLSVNRGRYIETDFVDLLVAPCVATFCTVGTECEAPVNGESCGAVHLPLKVLIEQERMLPSFRYREVSLEFDNGLSRIETFTRSNPNIQLGTSLPRTIDIPVNAPILDVLAIGQMLSPEELANRGFRERIEAAQRNTTRAVESASSCLAQFGVSKRELEQLVDCHVAGNVERLRAALGSAKS